MLSYISLKYHHFKQICETKVKVNSSNQQLRIFWNKLFCSNGGLVQFGLLHLHDCIFLNNTSPTIQLLSRGNAPLSGALVRSCLEHLVLPQCLSFATNCKDIDNVTCKRTLKYVM